MKQFALVLLVVALPASLGPKAAPGETTGAQALASLPAAARATISRVLGRDQSGYRAVASPDGFAVRNGAQGLTARFTAGGVDVRAGAARLGFGLRGYGYGPRLRPLAPVAPTASANRVSYRHGALTEWYVNGPLGLEQGFTVAAPPGERHGGELTIALQLSGAGAASLLPGGTGLRFSGASLRYQGLAAADATGRTLWARLELSGRALLFRVDDTKARYPITVDPFVQQAKLVAGGPGTEQLGWSVAVSGDTVVIGAPSSTHGAGYVFVKPSAGWASGAQTAKLTASDAAARDLGNSVAISGDTVVLGAPTVNGSHLTQGAVYVYVKPAGGWTSTTQTATLTASDAADSDWLGVSVAVDGDTIVAGAARTDGASLSAGQGAYLFVRPPAGWTNGTQTAKLTASDAAPADLLGASVGISGNTVVVGAPLADVSGHTDQGDAYVYVEPGTGWANATQTAKLTSSDGAASDEFGYAVAVASDTVVAGAPGKSSGGAVYLFGKPAGGWASGTQTAKLTTSDSGSGLGGDVDIDAGTVVAGKEGANGSAGAAYVFVRPVGGWVDATQTAKLAASDGHSGDLLFAVAVSGNTVVAGASYVTIAGHYGAGVANIFVKPAAGWANGTQTARLTSSAAAANDELGYSVAVSGDTVVVGAPFADVGANSDQGAAYVFVKPAAGWATAAESAKLTSSDGLGGDDFGTSVAVTGNTVVVGAPGANVGGASDQGAAYIFVKPAGGWQDGTQQAKLTSALGSQLGHSVAISGDTVVAGAPTSSAPGDGFGAAFVFLKPGAGWADEAAQAELTASDANDFDDLGWSVAIDADTVVAGTRYANAAYVFVKPAGAWTTATQTAKLTASSGGISLGNSVGISGTAVVAGVPLATVGGNSDQGAAYVFVRPGATWTSETQQATLTASGGAANDRLGSSVGISGDMVVAGAPFADVGGNTEQGAGYVFTKPGGGWTDETQSDKLTASDGSAGDQFGSSIGASSGTVVAGAPLADIVGNVDQGGAYVLVQQVPTAVQLLSLSTRREEAGVLVRWRTASEVKTLGFDVYRSGLKLNRALIPAGATTVGHAYSFLDRHAPRGGRLRYRIKAVGLDGSWSWVGSAQVR